MRQYLYTSAASEGFQQLDMVNLLEASSRNNGRNGITGFLVFDGQKFLQLVEGEQENLDALMERLARDPRHCNIRRLDDRATDRRYCPNWTMKRIVLSGNDAAERMGKVLPANLPLTMQRKIRSFIEQSAALA